MSDNVVILDGATEPDSMHTTVGGGEVCAFTTRAPDKDSENEDTVAVIPYGPDAAVLVHPESPRAVLVVADGAGGLPAGKRASATAVASLAESLHCSMEETMLLRTAILNGIDAANAAVQALGNGSATTLTVITIEGRLVQTTPHSPTGFAVEAGFLDEKEALHHEDRYLVSNFLGTADMRIDVGAEVQLQPRDTILLASDGLMDNVHVEEIIERVRKGSLREAINRVVSLAQRRMAGIAPAQPSKPDDLSVLLFRKAARPAQNPGDEI